MPDERDRPNKHLILIANGKFPDYPDLGDLVTPMGDIKALAAVLQATSRDTFATTILPDASTAEIFATLKDKLKAADPEDLVVIYYSGHGMLNRNMELLFAAHDIDGNADECSPNRRLRFEDLNDKVNLYNLRRVLFVLDCCHSAAAAKNLERKGDLAGALTLGVRNETQRLAFGDAGARMMQRSDAYRAQETKGVVDEGRGIYLMAACGASQPAIGKLSDGVGAFTKHLCDGLKSDAIVPARGKGRKIGYIPVSRLFSYVSQKMAAESPQRPLLFSRDVSGDDLVITNIYDLDQKNRLDLPIASTKFWSPVPTLENVAPSYVLEPDYSILDWNASFEALVAAPLRLVRGMHVQDFLELLDNWDPEVKTHSMKKFPPGSAPRVDTEKLELRTRRFGLVVFHKIASRLRDNSGRWCVSLNVSYVQWANKFWVFLKKVMERDEMWSTYAESYDPIISAFEDHRDLVRVVVEQVDGAKRCLDVGAGTGSTALQLLATKEDREVVALDINKSMLEKFDKKLDDCPPDYRGRTHIRLGDCHAVLSRMIKIRDEETGTETKQPEFADESFDACVMMNVLFALDRPITCLKDIYRVLKPGGVLSFSTSHGSTNIDRLFDKIRESLVGKEWEEKQAHYENALARNREMTPIIIRYNQADIERFLKQAGFDVEVPPHKRYVGCVLVYKAIKKKMIAVRAEG